MLCSNPNLIHGYLHVYLHCCILTEVIYTCTHTHTNAHAQVDSSVLTAVHVSSQVSTDSSPVELALKTTTVEELSTEETVYSSMDDNLHMLQVNVTQPDTQTEVVSSGIQPAVEVSETGVWSRLEKPASLPGLFPSHNLGLRLTSTGDSSG